MQVTVRAAYFAGTENTVDLPVDNWEEVKDWYVKWDTLYYTLNGKDWEELALNSDTEVIDWKRPVSSEIISDDGDILDEQ